MLRVAARGQSARESWVHEERSDVTVKRVVPNIRSAKFGESREFYEDFLGFNVGMDIDWID